MRKSDGRAFGLFCLILLLLPALIPGAEAASTDTGGALPPGSSAAGPPADRRVAEPPDRSAASGSPLDETQELATEYSVEVVPPPPARKYTLGVGAQVLVWSNPYRGGDTVMLALPMLTYVRERFFIVSPRAGYTLLKRPLGRINAIADYRFKGVPFESEGFLEGMEDRENTAMAGLDGHVRLTPLWRLESSAMTDLLNRHGGQEVNLVLSRVFRQNKLTLIPGAGLTWRSADFNNYYYGVSPSEATAERPAYDPGQSLEWFGRVALRYELPGNWSLGAAVRLEGLSGDLRDSPIVNKDYMAVLIAGLNYFF